MRQVIEDESLPRSASYQVKNSFLFKSPLNVVLTNHKPERDFVHQLIKQDNSLALDAWIKSTDQDFYPIEYAWRRGEHHKRGYFNPDFFIKKENHILVVEIKGDEELADPSEENKAKYKAADSHFKLLNIQQNEYTYHFHFLTPIDYDGFFQYLRESNYDFVSRLDVLLGENGYE